MRLIILAAAALAMTLPASGRTAEPPAARIHPDRWPAARSGFAAGAAVEARIDGLLRRMSVEDKVAQLLQVDIASIAPADIAAIRIGAVLNGGNSSPNNNETAPPGDWLALADAFWDASMRHDDGRPKVPVMWGIDAVHGNNNIVGATLFPHNIGLGAMRDPDLVRRIGAATAVETAAIGLDWTFGPTLAVVQDDRWGRTYESYSEEPALVASYAGAMVEGVQGRVGRDFMGPEHVIATAKHFLGDGGTGGRDQGDTVVSEAMLIDVHNAGYPPAIRAGALAVMASFSSWNGVKMHGNRDLLTDVLKARMGFNGLVVGDWNAHAQLPGCSVDHCPAAINAGLDMFMVSGDWRALYRNTLADVRAGTIPATRLDDAVRRILRVKALAGVLDGKRPSSRPLAGHFAELGSPPHRALARQAVRESLVLLKNENGVLPLRASAHILVAGRAADDIAQQSGGWTITWQGTGIGNADLAGAESIWHGIAAAVRAGGGAATLSPDGSFTIRPDAAIVVFGETPYAEFAGDRPTLEYSPGDKRDLTVLRRLRAAGIPVVAVFLSGRPLWVNPELNAADAFVAAFLPGSEGGGVADLLFQNHEGRARNDFRGRLSFSWPRRLDQYRLNRRDPDYDPLFAFGYGLTYARGGHVARLDETRPPAAATGSGNVFFARGAVPAGWSLQLADGNGAMPVTAGPAASPNGWLRGQPVDRRAQEDSRRFTWNGGGPAAVTITPDRPLDLTRESNAELSLVVQLRVDQPPDAAVDLAMASGATTATVAVRSLLAAVPTGQWTTIAVPLRCFAAKGLEAGHVAPVMSLATAGHLALTVSDVAVASVAAPSLRCS